MLAFLNKARKAVLAGVYAGSGAYAALSAVPGINQWVLLAGAVGAGIAGGFLVFQLPNAPDVSAPTQGVNAAAGSFVSGIKPPAS